jgi:hypothetical protein
LQSERIIPVSVALVLVALVLGVSIGYSISPVTTQTTTLTTPSILTATFPTTIIETVPTTITVVSPSGGQTYTVYTVTSKIVQVLIYIPECVTSSGQTFTSLSTVEASIITSTYISPSGVTYSGAVSFTTVTNTTVSISGRTQSESIAC